MSSKTKEKKERVLKPKSFGKKKAVKKKDPTKSKAAQALAKNKANAVVKKDCKTPGKMMDTLLLERKYTDEEIIEKVRKAFPEKKLPASYLNNHRWNLNNLPIYAPNCDAKKNPVERLFKKDGKLIPKSKMPKPERKTKKQYTEENDPLKKIAGINVHGKPKKKATPKKKAIKKGTPESTS